MNSNKTLSLSTIDYPFETLMQRACSNPPKLILDPDFQRKYKWDKEGWERASKFIESCLMRIPLPSCYFAEKDDGKHLVIDGVQRITTIIKFMNDEFELEGLSAFPNLNGKKFSQIGKLKSDLESTTIRCILLRNENPNELITEIFARLNQGSVSLSDQEIRHALFPGKFDKLIEKLAGDPIIKNFGLGKNSKRKKDSREDDELVLRFFAFDEKMHEYDGNLQKFLDTYMKNAINFNDDKIIKLEKKFNLALKSCRIIFEEDEIFSDINSERRRQGVLYYDLLMVTLLKIPLGKLRKNRKNLRNSFKDLCKSPDFKKLNTGGIQKKSSFLKRNALWMEKINGILQ